MKKNIVILITTLLLIVAPVFIFNDEISFLLAKDKPENVVYTHKSWYLDGKLASYTHLENKTFLDIYFSISDNGELSMRQLVNYGFLDYRYIDILLTQFNENGNVSGVEGVMPSKVIEININNRMIRLDCKRVIIHVRGFDKNKNIYHEEQSLLACVTSESNLNKDTDLYFIGDTTKEYEAIFKESIYNKTINIYRVKKNDLLKIENLSPKNFKVQYE